jgi:hypothetical protein
MFGTHETNSMYQMIPEAVEIHDLHINIKRVLNLKSLEFIRVIEGTMALKSGIYGERSAVASAASVYHKSADTSEILDSAGVLR